MKKIAKMSLVAAMAISGLTGASAADLTEAIKGVKVSGFISYTTEKVKGDDFGKNDQEANRDLDVRLQAVIPVNDMVTATIRFDENGDTAVNSESLQMEIDRAFFTYKNSGYQADFGLIGLPLTDGGQGDGIIVSKDFGVAKLSAGYFYSIGATKVNGTKTANNGSDEFAFVSVNGSVAPVSYYATYGTRIDDKNSTDVGTSTTDNEADMLHAGLSGSIEMVTLAVDYSKKSGMVNREDQDQVKVSIGADLGVVNVGLAYAANDKKGGKTMLDEADTAASNISVSSLELDSLGDASAIQFDISGNINETNKLAFTYAASDVEVASGAASTDQDVFKFTYTNMMSKNFSLFANYEINDKDDETDKRTELTLGAVYSF